MTGVSARKCVLSEIAPMRDQMRLEADVQIVGYSALVRGIADPLALFASEKCVGYAAVWNKYYPAHLGEFWVEPESRSIAAELLDAAMLAGEATHLMGQTNLPLWSVLEVRAGNWEVERLLFLDGGDRGLPAPAEGLDFRHVPNPSPNHPDSRDFGLFAGGAPIAQGGYLCHYNPPFADVHMEVAPEWRGRGVGAYYVQEVMRAARAAGKRPAARCSPSNEGSRLTLVRAGFVPCGTQMISPVA